MSRNTKPAILLTAALVLAAAAYFLPVIDWITAGIGWIQANRETAWIVFVLAYILATVLILPGSLLTLGAGFVFGLPAGVALVSAGSVTGAAAAFLIGRFLAREWVRRKISGIPKFRAVDEATYSRGFLIVLLIRLSPLFPFNLTNYGLGLTGVKFRDYFFASWIGMFPGTVLYVYIGTLAQTLADLTRGGVGTGTAGRALLIGGFVATLVLTLIVTRRATRALGRHLESESNKTA